MWTAGRLRHWTGHLPRASPVPGTALGGETERAARHTDVPLTELTSGGGTKQRSTHLCIPLHLRHGGGGWATCPRLGGTSPEAPRCTKPNPHLQGGMFQKSLPWGCLPGIPSPVRPSRAELWGLYPVQSEGKKKTGHGWGAHWGAG